MKLAAQTGNSIVSRGLSLKQLRYLANRERLSLEQAIEMLEQGPKETKGERQRFKRLQEQVSRFPL